MKRLFLYYKNSLFSMFLVGLFGGVICLMVHIIFSGIASEDFRFEYSTTIRLSIEGEQIKLSQEDCNEFENNVDVKREMKKILGSYTTYKQFKENCEVKLDKNIMIITYKNENEDRAKRIINRFGNVICTRLVQNQEIEDYYKIGITESERVKSINHNIISKQPITLFVEASIVFFFVLAVFIFTIVYIVNGRIKTKKDIVDELNIVVLANIPKIDELSGVN